ncbi:MAG: energy transducer TonB [Gammaproteobacteria bacterium]|nr:energy transducer TonB [Gammaproteobacteria bacterium]
MKNKEKIWLLAFVIGSMINTALFLILPRLGYSDPPPPAPIIKLDFVAWQEPIVKPIEPPKKAKPIPKPKPRPKPAEPRPVPPEPVKEPVLTEKEQAPVEEVVEQEIIEEPPEELMPTPTPVHELTNMPRIVHKADLIYPPAMRAQNKQALVKLEVLIDAEGRVRQTRVIKSGGEEFDKAAMEMAMGSTFIPANINGKPVPALYKIPYTFTLH